MADDCASMVKLSGGWPHRVTFPPSLSPQRVSTLRAEKRLGEGDGERAEVEMNRRELGSVGLRSRTAKVWTVHATGSLQQLLRTSFLSPYMSSICLNLVMPHTSVATEIARSLRLHRKCSQLPFSARPPNQPDQPSPFFPPHRVYRNCWFFLSVKSSSYAYKRISRQPLNPASQGTLTWSKASTPFLSRRLFSHAQTNR